MFIWVYKKNLKKGICLKMSDKLENQININLKHVA